jgi:hypothetical protein
MEKHGGDYPLEVSASFTILRPAEASSPKALHIFSDYQHFTLFGTRHV